MDKDMARILATSGAWATRELGNLVPMLAAYLPEDKELREGIATAIYEIQSNVIQPAFIAFPELETEFEERIRKYGRLT
jgi:hypothetical protein